MLLAGESFILFCSMIRLFSSVFQTFLNEMISLLLLADVSQIETFTIKLCLTLQFKLKFKFLFYRFFTQVQNNVYMIVFKDTA